jgi:hypothetical protein
MAGGRRDLQNLADSFTFVALFHLRNQAEILPGDNRQHKDNLASCAAAIKYFRLTPTFVQFATL